MRGTSCSCASEVEVKGREAPRRPRFVLKLVVFGKEKKMKARFVISNLCFQFEAETLAEMCVKLRVFSLCFFETDRDRPHNRHVTRPCTRHNQCGPRRAERRKVVPGLFPGHRQPNSPRADGAAQRLKPLETA